MQVWSKDLDWDYRGSGEMVLRYIEGKILPGYVAVREGRVEGYSFFVYEGSKGVIGDLYVSRDMRNQGTEARLLSHTVATLQRSPGLHRIEAQLLLHPTGALAYPFSVEGFRQYPRVFMVLPLHLASAGAAGAPAFSPEVEVRRWSEQDYHPAAAVITAAYQRHVDAEINDQYRTVNGSLRFLNNIVRFPGCGTFDSSASFVVYHRATRALLGLILCSRVKENVGHVTQVCVLPEIRGRHLGSALLRLTASELRRRNFSSLTLTVTQANTAAIDLYRRLGYSIQRVFDAYVWEG
jgi:ribosomal protein S18 acetylase RimI-like enzyme